MPKLSTPKPTQRQLNLAIAILYFLGDSKTSFCGLPKESTAQLAEVAISTIASAIVDGWQYPGEEDKTAITGWTQ